MRLTGWLPSASPPWQPTFSRRAVRQWSLFAEGKYTVVPLETITQGRKVVDVPELYDSEQYRPKVTNMSTSRCFSTEEVQQRRPLEDVGVPAESATAECGFLDRRPE